MGDKVQVGLELIQPNQVVNPMRGLWRRRDGDEVNICSIVHGYEHMEHGSYSQTWTYSSKGGDC